MQISRLSSGTGKSFVGKRNKYIYSMRSLILSQCRDLRIGGDMTEFGSLNHSPGKI